jgi:hypothetical protein
VRLTRRGVGARLVDRMAEAGFPLVKHEVLSENPIGRIIYPGSELVFNRGLDGKKSNFYVFVIKQRGGSYTLNYYNPDPKGVWLSRDGFLRKIKIPAEAPDQTINDAVQCIVDESKKKKDNEFFFAPHNHFGCLSPPFIDRSGKMREPKLVDHDDGVSFLTDNVRKAVLYHTDYYSLTSHNSFSWEAFRFMTLAGDSFGFRPVPGMELTAPLKAPNGPHVVVWMADVSVARLVKKAILDRGRRLDVPAYFTGMSMAGMLSRLFAFQRRNLLALGIAHPVNFNSPELPIPMLGLYSAVGRGALTLDQANEYAKRFDSVAMWNASLCSKAVEMRIKDKELKAYLKYVNGKHIGNRRLWVNQTNYALAMELREKFGLYTHFETDEHMTLPLYRADENGGFILGGDSMCSGTTVIEVPEDELDKKGRKPNVKELIEMIREKTVDMHGHVFAVKRKEAMTVHAERCKVPEELREIKRHYEHGFMRRYTGMLVRDFFDLLSRLKLRKIKHMPGR